VQTDKDDASVSQQVQTQLENEAYLRNLLAHLLGAQAAANANRNGSAQEHGTSNAQSLQGAKSAGGRTRNAPTAGGSTAGSSGSSANRLSASLGVSKNESFVPSLILGLVLGFSLLAAIEVRRRTRRAALVPEVDGDSRSAVDGEIS
jgi:hypothetical protein